MKTEFEEWFDIFVDHCRNKLNYHGPIDRDTFRQNWEEGEEPEEAAREFVIQMDEP